MRWSIRSQLVVPLLTLMLGVIGISTWTALASAHHAQSQIEQQVQSVVSTLQESDYPLTHKVLWLMKGLSGADFVLVDMEGKQTSTLPGDNDLPTQIEPVDPFTRAMRLGPRVDVGRAAYLGSAIRLPPARQGGTLYILYPYALYRDAMWEAVRPSLVLGVFGGLASLALALGVARRLSRRIQDLEQRTRLIAAGNFAPLHLTGRNDELRDLGQSINDMTHQLEQLQGKIQTTERLRLLGQVSGGLAHQLRNGVTGARLAVQVHVSECPTPADGAALSVALRQLALVEGTLKQFLDLGRTDAGNRENCSLNDLIGQCVELLRPQCRHGRTELRWQAADSRSNIYGDPGQLRHLFLNVIGNAIEAAGPGGWVDIAIASGSSTMVVTVSDSGPGPPAAIAGRLFEPFVTSKSEGVGLGLAVARQVAEAHGGSICWDRDQGHTHFRIELPLLT
jgi:signal transduction histidine kinase